MHSNRTTRGVASRAASELFEPQVNCLSVAVAVKVAHVNRNSGISLDATVYLHVVGVIRMVSL